MDSYLSWEAQYTMKFPKTISAGSQLEIRLPGNPESSLQSGFMSMMLSRSVQPHSGR